MIIFGSFFPSLLVGSHHQSLLGSGSRRCYGINHTNYAQLIPPGVNKCSCCFRQLRSDCYKNFRSVTANTQAFQANAPALRQALASVTVTVLLVIVILSGPKPWAQGPPFQTDDPVPVDLHHYEFYVFGAADGTPVEMDSVGPAFEFNWGALPRVQFHAILPFGVVAPLNNPVYAPSGIGRTEFGLTDMELGAKIAFIKESKHVPQIGTFTMFEIPTGDADRGLGVGKVWYKIPIWLQKNVGKWTFDGGAGYQVVPQDGFRNFPYTGWLLKKELSERLELFILAI